MHLLSSWLCRTHTALHALMQTLLREELRHLSQLSKSLPGYSVHVPSPSWLCRTHTTLHPCCAVDGVLQLDGVLRLGGVLQALVREKLRQLCYLHKSLPGCSVHVPCVQLALSHLHRIACLSCA
jgi:hypothetical protein